MTDVRRFELVQVRVPDTARPGKWIKAYEWEKCLDTALVVGGETYKASSTGWIDIPDEHARALTQAAAWMTRAKAAGLGITDVDDYEDEKPKPRGRKASGEG